jgi:aerotaxis receptor
MRNNQPVTLAETLVPEGVFIYSRTDVDSRIVEANDAFLQISGFERDELIGQPHNLVRHPDMPAAVFEDMWRDLKAGMPWRGVVKNRRKDGGFYWVVANASPVRENRQVVGFQSVRLPATRAEVAQAEAGYRALRAGKGWYVEHGRVLRTSVRRWAWLASFESQALAMGLFALLLGVSVFSEDVLGVGRLRTLDDVLASLICVLALLFVTVAIPRERRDLRAVAEQMGQVLSRGDLSRRFSLARIDHLGLISRRFDGFVASVQATMQGIADTAHHVNRSTRAVALSVHEVNRSAAVQSESTAAAAAAVEQVTVAIGEVASHASATREATLRSGDTARDGAEQSERASSTVLSLAETVKSSAGQVEELGRRAGEISRIADVIRDIADQTNLLALNAAIEAARAGETGRGFAVVADEVRKLAERTGRATQEIAVMVSAIGGETQRAVSGMQTGAGQVEASVELVMAAKQALLTINGEMANTAHMVAEISHATSEQQNAMGELSANINRVAEMTEQNVGVVSQAERLTDELDGSVDRMLKSVGQYTV